jgi:hypothetical protein
MAALRSGLRRRAAAAWDAFNSRVAPWLALLTGVASAILWREGVDGVRATFILMSLFATVTLLLLFPPWHEPEGAKVRSWLHGAAWWAAVSSAQNALWFVIPFYVVSTSWLSRNAPFTLLLIAFGVLSCFDTFVRDRILRRPGAAAIFVLPAVAAALQLFLPVLTGAPPPLTALVAGAVAAASSAALVLPASLSRRRLVSTLGSGALAGALAMRLLLPLVAPAPMRLASGTFALGRSELDPVDPVEVLGVGAAPAYVFVAVEAPRGMREVVHLVVEDGGAERVTRPLVVEGGRKAGYRLWAEVNPRAPGRIRATVITEGGQVVGAVRAEARAAEPAAAPPPPAP